MAFVGMGILPFLPIQLLVSLVRPCQKSVCGKHWWANKQGLTGGAFKELVDSGEEEALEGALLEGREAVGSDAHLAGHVAPTASTELRL